MDIVTHGLLGAITAQSASKAGPIRSAAFAGFFAALLPDADVLIRSDADPLLVLEYHRHFTHALAFVPIGALLASLLLWPFLRRHLSWQAIFGYALLGYATAGLLDACTSYGTRIFWPFSSESFALSIIAVVDPLFSLILIGGLIAAWRQRNPTWARAGLLLAGLYLGLGAVQHQRALDAAEALARDRGQNPERVQVKPTMGNLVLWRSLAVVGNTAYIDAVRVGLRSSRVYPGPQAQLVDPSIWGDLPPDSLAYRELHRFYRYSDRLLIAHPRDLHFIGDARYAMVPTETAPLWGISIDPDHPDRPITFEARRELTTEKRRQFLAMLRGTP